MGVPNEDYGFVVNTTTTTVAHTNPYLMDTGTWYINGTGEYNVAYLPPTPTQEVVVKSGDFVIVDGDGRIMPETYDTKAKALKAAARLARKNDDEYTVYAPVTVVRPKEPAVEVEDI